MFLLFFVFGGNAGATLKQTYTNDTMHSASSVMNVMVSRSGSGIKLQAPNSEYRVFQYAPAPADGVQVWFEGVCSPSTPHSITFGIKAIGNHPSVDYTLKCGAGKNNGAFKIPADRFFADSRYGGNDSGLLSANIYLNLGTSNAIQVFKVHVGSGLVAFDDLGAKNMTANSSLSASQPSGNAFSVIPDDVGQQGFIDHGASNDIEFNFAPDCDYLSDFSKTPVFLKWFDADVGQSNQPATANIQFTVTEYDENGNKTNRGDNPNGIADWRNGVITVGAANLGGQAKFVSLNIGRLYAKHTYKWHWTGINYSNGVQVWVPFSEVLGQVYPCSEYSAKCKLYVSGDGPGGVVTNSGRKYIYATLTNTSYNYAEPSNPKPVPIPENYQGGALSVNTGTYANPVYHGVPGVGLAAGATSQKFAIATLPSNYGGPTSANTSSFMNAWPAFYGEGSIGTLCPEPFDVYAPFTLTPISHQPVGDVETANSISYHTSVRNNASFTVNSTGSSKLYNKLTPNAPLATSTHNQNLSAGLDNAVWGLANYNGPGISQTAGAKYCSIVHIDHANGYRGPSGDQKYGGAYPGPSLDSNEDCISFHNEPYVHAFNSDVKAGGGFGKSCAQNGAGIQTYLRQIGSTDGVTPAGGSGAQFAAISKGPINGFSTAILRTNSPDPLGSIGLSFAKPGAAPANTSSSFGGSYGASHCVPDYFSKNTEATVVVPSDPNKSSFANSDIPAGLTNKLAMRIKPNNNANGTLTINGLSIPAKKRMVLYVDGYVHITNSITFNQPPGGWASVDDIPSLFIISNKSILIDPGVSQLDGVYVAQGSGAAGVIDTCVNSAGNGGNGASYLLSDSTYFNICAKQLVVNGAFVANHVRLKRTFGSLRDSSLPDRYGAGGKTCQVGTATGPTGLNDCAAEIFNFTPEIYLANPDFAPTSGPTTGTFDYMTSLSPVL